MDIDIDFPNRATALALFDHVVASRYENSKLVKHNTGVYFQRMPIVADKNISAIPYNELDETTLFKIDFLNVSIYNGVRDEEHLILLMNQEPIWELLEQDDFVNLLFHVNGHGNILREMKPKSVSQLAAVLAMIRPAKRYLVGKSWSQVDKEIWTKPVTAEYYWKKSHAYAYATTVIVQMNLICEKIQDGSPT